MKKFWLFLFVSSIFFVGCDDYYSLLKKSGGYESSGQNLNYEFKIDSGRAAEIRNYFSDNTELNLNELNAGPKSTIEKTFEIANFVSKNIPHANQKTPVEKIDPISLWEYHLNIEEAFNCKFHSMFTNELLLSVGIVSRYVWCMPKSEKDNDCHVVNNVWIPELSKWIMIDTDQKAYVCDQNENPLSIQEIREKLISKDCLNVHSFGQMKQSAGDYLNYLSKDFYWFTVVQKVRFAMDKNNSDPNNYINLLPTGFNGFRLGDEEIRTHDDENFWSAPEIDFH